MKFLCFRQCKIIKGVRKCIGERLSKNRGETESTRYVGHCSAYCTSPGLWTMMCGAVGGMLGRGNRSAGKELA
jgi:hypothetical protein